MGSYNEQQQEKCVRVNGPIIVGAGPSGLAVAACLTQHGVPCVLLERGHCIASLWKNKTYDRLKLHLPKHFCQLPLMNFPSDYPMYPSKNQFISYIESYASRFSIQPRFNQTVLDAHFDRSSSLWTVRTEDSRYVSPWLVVASGENADPFVPNIPGLDSFHGPIFHSCEYKSGSDYNNKKVLVVGCGNSGMEVSFDLCNHNAITYMVARNTVHVLPREMFGISTFQIAMVLLKWLPVRLVDKFILLMTTFIFGNIENCGLRRPKTGPMELKNSTGKSPVLDVGALEQIRCGKIQVLEGVKEITRDGAKFMNGIEKDFDAIILATGYRSNVPNWLKGCEFFTREGMPRTPFPNGWKAENGLYTVGFTKRGLLGATSDAIKVAKDIADQWKSNVHSSWNHR